MNKNRIWAMIKILLLVGVLCLTLTAGSCSDATVTASRQDTNKTLSIGDKLSKNQPTPTDLEYSVERYLLQKRTYWVNGQRDKARTLPCPIPDMPLGYVICFAGNVVVGQFPVDGKLVSLNSFLGPDSEYYEKSTISSSLITTDEASNKWLPDVDGAFGVNEDGVFWFSPDGNYFEWVGAGKSALYSDYPFKIDDPILVYEVKNDE